MTKKKYIIVACNYAVKQDRIGGMDRFFRAYNDQLVQLGHKVSWIFAGGELINFYSGLDINFPKKESLEKTVLDFIENRDHVDVLVSHFLELCTPFYKAAKGKGVKYIIAVDHNPRPLNGFSLKKQIRNRLKGLFYSTYIDQFVGVSNYTKDFILKDYGSHLKNKTCIIYNGIDSTLFLKRKFPNEGHFIVASHLRESKGIQDLIEAVGQIPDDLRNQLVIDIYGEGPLESHLKEKVALLKLQSQFQFLGSSSDLTVLYHKYSFLLQPTYAECFSLSILESLAANVPVVTTTVGGNREIIRNEENGYFHEPGDIEGLENLLIDILKSRKKISNNVYEEIEREFPLEKMVRDHIRILPE